jgi:hypothetical protein
MLLAYCQPMADLPRVFPSGAFVAKVGDVEVYLLTVESWGEHVVVRLAAASTDATRAEMAADEAEMNAWAQRRRDGADEWPPSQPGDRIAKALRVRVEDETGTKYCLSVKTGGGSGTEHLSEWIFKPALPSDASTLSVTITSKNGGTHVATFET